MTNNVYRVLCTDRVRIDSDKFSVCYKVLYFDGKKSELHKDILIYHEPEKSTEIVGGSDKFVNGYKVVKLANGMYGYVREYDGMLMPYEYDIAFDFNEHGYAMVGKAGTVSWINEDFLYLDSKGNMVSEANDSWKYFDGWQAIFAFSGKETQLSRLYCGKEDCARTVYFDPIGELKSFSHFNRQTNEKELISEFSNGTDFDNNAHALADNFVLSSQGYGLTRDDIVESSIQSGYVDTLFREVRLDSEFGQKGI